VARSEPDSLIPPEPSPASQRRNSVAPREFMAKLVQLCVLIDAHEFDLCYFRKVLQVLHRDWVAESRVMRATRKNPRGCSHLQARPCNPDCTCDGKLRQRLTRATTSIAFAIIRKRVPMSTMQATTAGPADAVNTRRTGRLYRRCRGMHLKCWFAGGNRRTDLEHMCCEFPRSSGKS